MKKQQLLFLLICASVQFAFTQIQPHKADLYLKVIDYSEQTIPFLKVCLKNEEGTQPQYSVTDVKGNATFQVTTGNSYQVFINDTFRVSTLHIPVNSLSYVTRKITIPELSEEQMAEKKRIDTIDQKGLRIERPDPGNIFFKVGIFNHLRQAVKNVEVRIYNPKLKLAFLSKTNNYGYAFFHVPGGDEYEVAVADFEHFQIVKAPQYSYTVKLTYIPTKVREYENNDTIIQTPDNYMRATTDRALLKVQLKDHDNKPLINEQVCLDVIGSTKVYKGKTGNDGVLKMLLPKGHQYELNFKYERAMKRLDYPMSPTLYSTQFHMTYIGSKKVEDFYARAKKAEGEFRTEFMEPKAKPVKMEPKIIEITKQGFNLNFAEDGVILSPAVHKDKLFVSSGFYSPNIFCVNARTGQSEWGIRLAESGPSVLVIEDGMLLINTQSCTLYAIDIETGMLAWSKWLGPNIYHSPTIFDGKVYASYPDGIDYSANDFVLAAFNLKTGNIVWQNRLKGEPLAAPVIANNQVFITDLHGWLYNFDAQSGESVVSSRVYAVNPPVIFKNSIWINTIESNSYGKSVLAEFNANTFVEKKRHINYKDTAFSSGFYSLGASEKMSYSRNRVLVNKDNFYQINDKGLHAFSANGEIKWNLALNSDLSFSPTLGFAGKYLLATEGKTKIALVDAAKGIKIKEYQVSDIISSEPVAANGWIYCGTKNGKLVAINTKDKSITGWYQWGMNAQHNPVIE